MKYLLSQEEFDKLQEPNDLSGLVKQLTIQRDELINMILKADTTQIVMSGQMLQKIILIGIKPRTMPKQLQDLLERRLERERRPGGVRLRD